MSKALDPFLAAHLNDTASYQLGEDRNNEISSSYRSSIAYGDCGTPPSVKASSFSPFQFMAFATITISTIINIVNANNNNNNNNDNNNNSNLVGSDRKGVVILDTIALI